MNGFIITNGLVQNGGGIYCGFESDPIITNNTINANEAYGNGGGIYIGENASPYVINNTLDSNLAALGGSVYCANGSKPVIGTNIMKTSPEDAYEIYAESGASPDNDCNWLWNAFGEYANISTGANSLADHSDDPPSCIDAGDDGLLALADTLEKDQEGKPRSMDGIWQVDMGALEFGDACEAEISGDMDDNVDGVELAGMASEFSRTDYSSSSPCDYDFNGDNQVNYEDLETLVHDLGRTNCP